jgi:aldehyde:ferredoxin oxidoreductase
MHAKGLELPAYDSRATKILGLAFAVANRGVDHVTSELPAPTYMDAPILVVENSHIEDPYKSVPAEANIAVDLENSTINFDNLGGCKFMGMMLMAEDYVVIINAATGWEIDVPEFVRIGERCYNLARAFNVREGLTRSDDMLPPRLLKDPLPEGSAKGLVVEPDKFEQMKDAYYTFRGWDLKTGIPTIEKLKELDLEGLYHMMLSLA